MILYAVINHQQAAVMQFLCMKLCISINTIAPITGIIDFKAKTPMLVIGQDPQGRRSSRELQEQRRFIGLMRTDGVTAAEGLSAENNMIEWGRYEFMQAAARARVKLLDLRLECGEFCESVLYGRCGH